MSKAEIKERVMETLTHVDMEHAAHKLPSEISGGMAKRAGMARALIRRPDIILYDEPTTGLDPITSNEIVKLILKIQKDYNTASLIITHDMDCARVISNRMIILQDGINYAEGTYEELSRSNDPKVRGFFKIIILGI